MLSRKHIFRYGALLVLALMLGAVVYMIGKTPQVIEAALVQVRKTLYDKHGIELQLGQISVKGFLTVQVDNFILRKKDINLLVQAQSIRAKLSPFGYLFDGNPVSHLEIDSPEVMARADLESSQAKVELPLSLQNLVIKNGRAEIEVDGKTFSILNANLRARISPKHTFLSYLEIKMPEGDLKANGQIDLSHAQYPGLGSSLHLDLSTSLIRIPELRKLPISLKAQVALQGRVDYKHIKTGPHFQGVLQTQDVVIDTVVIRSLLGPIEIDPKGLQLRRVQVGFAGTEVFLTGGLQFNRHVNFKAILESKKISLYKLLSDIDVKDSWVDLQIDTKVQVKGQAKPFSIEGTARGVASKLLVKDHDFQLLKTAYPIQFDMGLEVTPEVFRFKKARLKDAKSRGLVDCDLFFKKPGMWLRGQFQNFNFASIQNRIAKQSYAGSGQALVSIDGAYEDIQIKGPVRMDNFQFEEFKFGNLTGLFRYKDKKIEVERVEGSQKSLGYSGFFSVDLKPEQVHLAFDAEVKKGLAEDLRGSVLPWLKSFDWQGPFQGHVKMSGPVAAGYRDLLSANLELTLMENSRLFGVSVNSGVVKGHMDQSDAKVTRAYLNTEVGKFKLEGQYDKVQKTGQGILSIEDSVASDGNLNLSIISEHFSVAGMLADSKAKVQVQVGLEESLPYEAEIAMPYGPLFVLMPKFSWLEKYQVQAGVRGKAKGSLRDFQNSQVSLDLFPAVFYLGTLKLIASQKIAASYQEQKLSMAKALFKSAHGDVVELGGALTGEDVDLKFKTTGDLWFLTHLDDRFEGAYGDFKVDVDLHGPFDNLRYLGSAQIACGSYISLRDYPPGLTNLCGEVLFLGPMAQVKLTGTAYSGNFNLQGNVDLKNRKFGPVEVQFEKMPVYYGSFLSGIADGNLSLTGFWEEPLLSGNVEFSELLVTKELDPTAWRAPRSRAKKQAVKLDVSLTSKTPVQINSRSFHGDINGKLKLVGTLNAPSLLGELDVLSGEIYFKNHYYQIIKARANFDNPFRVVPYIDLEANSQILDYDVTVRAQGELSKPKLQFSSRPSLPQSELFNLVTFGFTSRENRDSTGATGAAGLEALSSYSGVGDKLLQLVPGQAFDEFRLGTLYTQDGTFTSSVVLGMQVFKGIRLRFQSALLQNSFGNREKRLELERYISRRWRWRLSWNSDGVTNWGDAGADLWVRWDF